MTQNGYEVLRGKRLKSFIAAKQEMFAKDMNVLSKIRQFGVFDFRAVLNLAIFLSESDQAKALRQMTLDVVIDLIHRKTGGGTKYINQRDKIYVFPSLQEDNYLRNFTDALKECVEEDHAHFTDIIYVSIFREKAKEYKKILDR